MLLNLNGVNVKIAGNCVYYDHESRKFKCEKLLITATDGHITSVSPFNPNEKDNTIVELEDKCVIFPGLSDLHSHVDYNMMQVWNCQKEFGIPWDNRHEWRKSKDYKTDIKETQDEIARIWMNPFSVTNGEDVKIGDVMLYFSELQAACGGTTVLQEDAPFGSLEGEEELEFQYPFLLKTLTASDVPGSHAKYVILRSTGIAQDLDFADSKEVISYVDLYQPDAGLTPDDRKTYSPHRDTSGWELINAKISGEEVQTKLERALQQKSKTGFLIHLAEGRAGNIFWMQSKEWEKADQYSKNEFLRFKKFILDGERAGKFSAEDVVAAHINLIHGCGIDLSIEENYRFVKEHGIGIIWSPVSNLLLYGDTPKVYNYLGDEDLLIGIGSDWSPSGSKHVWDECKFAEIFMQRYASDKTSVREKILKSVTVTASKMIGCEKIGNIQTGAFADFFVLRSEKSISGDIDMALETFFKSDDTAVELVMLGGVPIYGKKACIANFADVETNYAKLPTTMQKLPEKRIYIPEHFKGIDFQAMYNAYVRTIQAKGIDFSYIWSCEDTKYQSAIAKLRTDYPGLETNIVDVSATTVWNDTGIEVNGNVLIEYVSGECCISPSIQNCKADGRSGFRAKEGYLLPGANEGSLIVKFGNNGEAQLVGSRKIFENVSGRLYLGVNDDVYGRYGNGYKDNSGKFVVNIYTKSKPEE